MELKHTGRGFAYYEFTEVNGDVCNIQKSSSTMQDCIWLGSKNIGLKGFIPHGNPSWRDVTDDQIKEKFGFQDIIANNRMHLSREQVAALLPILQKFVDTGEID
jgi:hypothetical protein